MDPQTNKTKMVADPERTKMDAPAPSNTRTKPGDGGLASNGRPKTVRLRVSPGREVMYEGQTITGGNEFDCDEESAKDFTHVFQGTYAFSRIRDNDDPTTKRHEIVRCVRVEKTA